MQETGYAVVADATSCTHVIARAVHELFTELAGTGSSAAVSDATSVIARAVHELFTELAGTGSSAVVADATSCTYVIARAVHELFTELAGTGSSAAVSDRIILSDEFNRLVGLPEIRERERGYYAGCG